MTRLTLHYLIIISRFLLALSAPAPSPSQLGPATVGNGPTFNDRGATADLRTSINVATNGHGSTVNPRAGNIELTAGTRVVIQRTRGFDIHVLRGPFVDEIDLRMFLHAVYLENMRYSVDDVVPSYYEYTRTYTTGHFKLFVTMLRDNLYRADLRTMMINFLETLNAHPAPDAQVRTFQGNIYATQNQFMGIFQITTIG